MHLILQWLRIKSSFRFLLTFFRMFLCGLDIKFGGVFRVTSGLYEKYGEDRAAVVFFGDGSAQKGDVHTGMNFSAVLKAQTMFVCRNNGYGISTPA